MRDLEAAAPGACKLRLYDPNVSGLPEDQRIPGSHTFEKVGLGGRTEQGECPECNHSSERYTLVDLLKRDGLQKADLLKVDVESAEYESILHAMCRNFSPDQPLPFDQLLIEVHQAPKRLKNMTSTRGAIAELLTCLEQRDFVEFSREPNLHDCVCRGTAMWSVEFAFVRRRSVFTSEAAAVAATLQVVRQRQNSTGGVTWAEVLEWQELQYQIAMRRREKYAQIIGIDRQRGRTAGRARVAVSSTKKKEQQQQQQQPSVATGGWYGIQPWRCSRGPAYLWDLFEPRYPCPMRRFNAAASPSLPGLHRMSCLRAPPLVGELDLGKGGVVVASPSSTSKRKRAATAATAVDGFFASKRGPFPVVAQWDIVATEQWDAFLADCRSGKLSHYDEILLRMELTRLVGNQRVDWRANPNAYHKATGRDGPAVMVSSVVKCLEGVGFRIFGNEIEAEQCERDQHENSPRAAWLGFVRRDSPWLMELWSPDESSL